MEYQQRPHTSNTNDHENSDYIMTRGDFNELLRRTYEERARERTGELDRFDKVWDALAKLVQEPNTYGGNLRGYTGHRIVTIIEPDVPYALGFYLQEWKTSDGAVGERIVDVYWRRVYSDDDRRVGRYSDEDRFTYTSYKATSAHNKPLSKLEVLYEKYIQAPSYGDAIEYPMAS